MMGVAQRDAIVRLITQFWVITPRQDVVGFYFTITIGICYFALPAISTFDCEHPMFS